MGDAKELRVHGVGGSPGPRLLGLTDPAAIEIVGEGVGTAFWTRRRDRSVEGYDWGALTSGSSLQSLWVLLLPFTLLNVAGWMHPPGSSLQTRIIRAIVHTLSALMTLSWVLWFAIIFIDLLGYQWTRRLTHHSSVRDFSIFGFDVGAWLVEPGAVVQPFQWIGSILGLLVVVLVMWGIQRIAGNTQKAFEAVGTCGAAEDEERWRVGEDLGSSAFFARPAAAARLLNWHKVMVGFGLLLVIGRFLWQGPSGPKVIDFGHFLLACAALEFALLLALAAVSWSTGSRAFLDRLRCAPAVAAVLSFFLANALFSGAIVFVVKRCSGFPKLPEAAGKIVPGPELALTDAWLPLIFLSLVVVAVWILGSQKLGSADELRSRTSGPGRPLDGVDETWRQKVKKARGLALGARKSPWVVGILASAFFVSSLVLSLQRICFNGSAFPFDWTRDARVEDSFWWGAAASALAAMPLLLVVAMRLSLRSESARRRVGILWDVLTFWPRRFHPFAVRPYSERAVVELRERVRLHLEGGHPVVVSAHSQGSVIAFAALSSLNADDLKRVAFVSYGSPLSTLYSQTFPAYFGEKDRSRLTSALMGGDSVGWRNFHRDTDPIGGPVFRDGSERDRRLQDPAITAELGDAPEDDDIEPDRVAWVELAGHSHYLREPELKEWVRDIKTRLASFK